MSIPTLLALTLAGLNLGASRAPFSISAGDEVSACGWPSVVALLRDSAANPGEQVVLCSGTLVTPSVVLTAASCIIDDLPIVAAGFGEVSPPVATATRTIDVLDCEVPPEALPLGSLNTFQHDVAICRLAEPVDDVPIVPLISSCERAAVVPDAEVTIVGFGSTEQIGTTTAGFGRKRTATQRIDGIDTDVWHNIRMFNLEGSAVCGGDFGGPAFIQLGDGSWRVFGAASSAYSPPGVAPPVPEDNACWGGSVYTDVAAFIAWIEDAAGAPVACHDEADAWSPDAPCERLQSDPGSASDARWDAGCDDGSAIAAPDTCPSSGTGGETEGSSTGDDEDPTNGETTTDPSGSTGDVGTTSAGTDPQATTDSVPAGSSGGDDGAPLGDGTTSDGCSCRSAGGGPSLPLLAGAMFVFVGRRRRRSDRLWGEPRDQASTTIAATIV